MRIVLDTNALLISIPKNSKYRIIFNRFLLKQFTLVISNDILTEYAEIIDQSLDFPQITVINIDEFIELLKFKFL